MPIVLMTGYIEKLRDLPVNNFFLLPKPFVSRDLFRAIWKLITTAAINGEWPDSRWHVEST